MIFPFKQIRNCTRRVKWWFMRANRRLPPCDWWDFKITYVDFLAQGLIGLLYESNIDWNSKAKKKEKEELEFILDWAVEFPYYEYSIIAEDDDDWKKLREQFRDSDVLVLTKKQRSDYEKKTAKAMRLLAKNIHGLWN